MRGPPGRRWAPGAGARAAARRAARPTGRARIRRGASGTIRSRSKASRFARIVGAGALGLHRRPRRLPSSTGIVGVSPPSPGTVAEGRRLHAGILWRCRDRAAHRVRPVTTVREAAFDLFRRHGMTTVFGNPGSTELPFLARLPRRLPLRPRPSRGAWRSAWPTGTRRRPAGRRTSTSTPRRASATRWARSSTPRRTSRRSVITAGQQARSLHDSPGPLTNRDAAARAASLRQVELRAAARRRTSPCDRARDPPRDPAAAGARRCLDPDGRLGHRGRRRPTPKHVLARRGLRPGRGPPDTRRRPRQATRGSRAARRSSPAPTSTPPAAGTRPSRSPSARSFPSGRPPPPGGGRLGFPEGHPNFRGQPAAGPSVPPRRDPRPPTTS